jgi:predicted RND superfamily exporter protein
VSTAIGFGSLALADNDGLASLGRVCASGTLITMTVAVFLLPAWWRALDTKGADRSLKDGL